MPQVRVRSLDANLGSGTSSLAGYDEFARLVSVDCTNSGSTNVWNQRFGYDIYNNITKSVPPGGTGIAWAPGYSSSNNQYTLAGTTYDSNGNLLTDTFHTYTWNQDNKLKAITDAGITMTYDAFGRMIEKATGTTYNQELISPIGAVAYMQQQSAVQFRMPLPGGDTAVPVLTAINFQHRDWLGSVRLESTRVGRTWYLDRAFAPYGETYNSIGSSTDVNFTGDNQDLVAGTFDTPNRELNPTQGRWISPDPLRSGWNAYSYTTNPLSLVDPTGLRATEYPLCGCGGWDLSTMVSDGDGGVGSLGDFGLSMGVGDDLVPISMVQGEMLGSLGYANTYAIAEQVYSAAYAMGALGMLPLPAMNFISATAQNQAADKPAPQPAPTDPNGNPTPPPVPVPGAPDLPWKWNPNRQNPRGGTWGPDGWKGPNPPNGSWDPAGHWDINGGKGEPVDHYDPKGNPITPGQAHPGNAPSQFSISPPGAQAAQTAVKVGVWGTVGAAIIYALGVAFGEIN